jgi:hypothetical protein
MIEKALYPQPISVLNGTEIVDFFLNNPISAHPFFSKENRFNIGYVKLILENGRDLDITGFLSRTISMTSDLKIRCALVPQLFDELGSGDYTKIHIFHIVNLLNAIEPLYSFKYEEDKKKIEPAYHKLSITYQKLFFSDNFSTCIGVAIANEIVVQPIFDYIKETVYRHKNKLDPKDIIWVTAHDELEEDHVSDTIQLSKLISQHKEDLNETFQSGYELLIAFWEFFDLLETIALTEK